MSLVQINTKTEIISNTYEINAINVKIGELILNTSVVVYTDFLNNNGSIIKTTRDILTDWDYKNWGTNDLYIIDWICRKYALQKK
jgi:hypothetical protein